MDIDRSDLFAPIVVDGQVMNNRHPAAPGEADHRPVDPTDLALFFLQEVNSRILDDYTEALSVLALAGAEASDVNTCRTLAEIARRLRLFAEVHHALQAPLTEGEWDLGEHLERMCSAVALGRLSERNVHLALIRSDAPLSSQRCWRIGLIVAELITNASLRAVTRSGNRGGRIVVEVYTSAGDTCCRISEDGGFQTRPPGSARGIAIVEALARDLKGRVRWKFGVSGTTVDLTVPTLG